jgi:hypothetical protein
MAVAPTSSVSRAVAGALHEAGVDCSSMPAGYTRAQYEAFWGAGYTPADIAKLEALWHTDDIETKSRAGQMLIEGKALPRRTEWGRHQQRTQVGLSRTRVVPRRSPALATRARADERVEVPEGQRRHGSSTTRTGSVQGANVSGGQSVRKNCVARAAISKPSWR